MIIIIRSPFFRRKTYRLCKQWNKIINMKSFQTIFNSVDHVIVESKEEINEYMYYFSHVTKLTLHRNIFIVDQNIPISFSHTIPLKQIKTLIIDCNYLCPLKMCHLLSYMPNVHTLTFRAISFYEKHQIFIEQNELFQSISKINLVKNVSIDESCTLIELKLILKLFPHLQSLEISTKSNNTKSILQHLLNKNTNHLILLSFLGVNKTSFHQFHKLLLCEIFLHECKIIYNERDRMLYVWW